MKRVISRLLDLTLSYAVLFWSRLSAKIIIGKYGTKYQLLYWNFGSTSHTHFRGPSTKCCYSIVYKNKLTLKIFHRLVSSEKVTQILQFRSFQSSEFCPPFSHTHTHTHTPHTPHTRTHTRFFHLQISFSFFCHNSYFVVNSDIAEN